MRFEILLIEDAHPQVNEFLLGVSLISIRNDDVNLGLQVDLD